MSEYGPQELRLSHDARKSNHHIAANLGISQADTQALARCHKSKDWYFGLIRKRRDA